MGISAEFRKGWIVAAILVLTMPLAAQSNESTIAFTQPSRQSKVSFLITGKVAKVPVVVGQQVKAGDTLIQLDDSVERKTLQFLELEAASTLGIEAAQKELENARVTLERVETMFEQNVANESELLEARLGVDIAEIRLRKAREDHELKKIERDKQAEQVRQMNITSPIDGFVAQIDVNEGEIVDPRQPACTVVNNEPLWVELTLPAAQAARIEGLKSLRVRHLDEENWTDSKVLFVSPVVDVSSDMRRVRLEMPNPHGRPSGLQVLVELPAAVAEAGKPHAVIARD